MYIDVGNRHGPYSRLIKRGEGLLNDARGRKLRIVVNGEDD
jgi:hypothetical protein